MREGKIVRDYFSLHQMKRKQISRESEKCLGLLDHNYLSTLEPRSICRRRTNLTRFFELEKTKDALDLVLLSH